MKRSVVLVLLSLALSLPVAASGEEPPGADLAGLLELARARNPEFAAMRHEAEAAAARIEPAGALPDPMLRLELMGLTRDGEPDLFADRVGATRLTLLQQVPWFGKRALRRDAAADGAATAAREREALWTELAAAITAAHAQYYGTMREIAIADETLERLVRMEEAAQALYATGRAGQADVIRAQAEQTAVRGGLAALEARRQRLQAMLNALLSRPTFAPLAAPMHLREAAVLPDFTALEARLRETNPRLAAAQARIDKAEKERSLVWRDRYSDFTLGFGPALAGDRTADWQVMVEVNIPLQQGTRRHREREAESLLRASAAAREAEINRLLAALGEQSAGYEAAQRSETLARLSLVPQAQAGYEAALAAYETGRGDFGAILDAANRLSAARLEQLRSEVDAALRLAEIERLIGEDL